MRRLLLAIALIGPLLGAEPAVACSCIPTRDAAEQLARSDRAFVGIALSKRPLENGRALTTFKVVRSLKGPSARNEKVAHETSGPACGVRYAPGKSYLILASVARGQFTTSSCSGPWFPLEAYDEVLQRR